MTCRPAPHADLGGDSRMHAMELGKFYSASNWRPTVHTLVRLTVVASCSMFYTGAVSLQPHRLTPLSGPIYAIPKSTPI